MTKRTYQPNKRKRKKDHELNYQHNPVLNSTLGF